MCAIPDASIDAVISSYFWEHMAPADKPLILAEIRRVLKPGGKIIFVFDVATKNPLITWMRRTRPELYQALFIDSDGHLGYETADENDALIRKHGFRITRSLPMERTPLQSASVYSKLADWPGPLRLVGRGLSILNRQPLLHLYTALLRLIDETIGHLFPAAGAASPSWWRKSRRASDAR
ncbi:MAG: hypothetical protein RL274_1555 [Pseudomonadota bacterium]|jgi:SAM-dependent methyltransferase